MISVSVAMATYNGERFIREQLDSLAAQERPPSELVITDDGSTDNTLEIAEQFARTAPFAVRIHRNDSRLGFSANFMRAASLCTSDVIAFCDQDDIWSPRKFAVCIEAFKDPAVLLVYHNAKVVTEACDPLGSLDSFASAPLTSPLASSPLRLSPLGFTEVFRRSLLDLTDLWKISQNWHNLTPMTHDHWVFIISSVSGNIAYIDEHLACYRQHASNLYGWNKPLSFFPRNIRRGVDNPARSLKMWQQSANRFSEILEKAKANVISEWHDQAALGSTKYRFLALLFQTRSRIYTMSNFNERLRAVREIISMRGYRSSLSWGVGRRALALDLCVGLPIGHLL